MNKIPTEKKFGKYLTYAIGEIFLVVVGILIALQINNYNNNKQQRKIEQVYLLSLQTEFRINLKKIDDCIFENTERLEAVEEMLSLFDKNIRDSISDKAISNILYAVFSGEAIYKPSQGVLTDIISSGHLNLIQNEKLRQLLASFESTLDFLTLVENTINSMKAILKNQLNKNGSIRKLLKDKGTNLVPKSISDSIN